MSFRSYREISRDNWGSDHPGALTRDQIQLGAILRIADATEKMCLDREKLERDYQYMRNSRDRYRELYEAARRRSAARCVHSLNSRSKIHYRMPCHVLKTMPNGRLKLLVFGDRYWKDTQHKSRLRYVPASRVTIKTGGDGESSPP